jgi:hypothetical protein
VALLADSEKRPQKVEIRFQPLHLFCVIARKKIFCLLLALACILQWRDNWHSGKQIRIVKFFRFQVIIRLNFTGIVAMEKLCPG